jgi:hypothetical protein
MLCIAATNVQEKASCMSIWWKCLETQISVGEISLMHNDIQSYFLMD